MTAVHAWSVTLAAYALDVIGAGSLILGAYLIADQVVTATLKWAGIYTLFIHFLFATNAGKRRWRIANATETELLNQVDALREQLEDAWATVRERRSC